MELVVVVVVVVAVVVAPSELESLSDLLVKHYLGSKFPSYCIVVANETENPWFA